MYLWFCFKPKLLIVKNIAYIYKSYILIEETKIFHVFQIIALEVQTKICVFFQNKFPPFITTTYYKLELL